MSNKSITPKKTNLYKNSRRNTTAKSMTSSSNNLLLSIEITTSLKQQKNPPQSILKSTIVWDEPPSKPFPCEVFTKMALITKYSLLYDLSYTVPSNKKPTLAFYSVII